VDGPLDLSGRLRIILAEIDLMIDPAVSCVQRGLPLWNHSQALFNLAQSMEFFNGHPPEWEGTTLPSDMSSLAACGHQNDSQAGRLTLGRGEFDVYYRVPLFRSPPADISQRGKVVDHFSCGMILEARVPPEMFNQLKGAV
jgi:hypothetical protein